MYISKIKIEKFRLFKQLEVTLNKKMNILVGENNSGKTALIDAIKYVLDTNSAEWVNIQDDDFFEGENSFKISVLFEELTVVEAASFVEYLTYEDGEVNGVLYLTLECQRGIRSKKGFIRKEFKCGKNQEVRMGADARDHLAATYLKPLRDAETELLSKRGSRLAQILLKYSDLKTETVQKKIVELLKQAFKDIKDKSKSTTDSIKNAENEISKYLKKDKLLFNNDNLKASISASINDEKITSEFRQILEKLDLKFSDSSNKETNRQGLGYQNILFIATELLLLEKEQEIYKLLLIEEPEAHLHPQLQMKLLKTIQEEKNMQCLLSTHSPNLASKASVDSLILMKDGKAFSLRKHETRLEDDDYKHLEKFLDVTKANLFFAKSVILVEGWAEEILFPTIARLIGRPLGEYGVTVINIGHTGLFRFSRIFQRKNKTDDSVPVKVANVKDRDLRPSCVRVDSGGYIEYKPHVDGKPNSGNEKRWEEYYDERAEDRKIRTYEDKFTQEDDENVITFFSDKWTLEYDLAYSGLGAQVWKALGNSGETIPVDTNQEKYAAKIYKPFIVSKKSKAETSYALATILENNFENKPSNLISILPKYIVRAIEHVTEQIIQDKGNEATNNNK